MSWTSEHIKWLTKSTEILTSKDGKLIEIWELKYENDEKILSAWAKHLRNHYCLDSEIDILIYRTHLTKTEYLNQIKFPSKTDKLGPSIRSGDFSEILVADFLEFVLGFCVPRSRYIKKTIRNESTKGADIIGFKLFKENEESPRDILAIFEAKAQLSSKSKTSRLQDAIDGSAKDKLRKGESLNALKQHFLDMKQFDDYKMVSRFQDSEDSPYIELSGAAVVISYDFFDANQMSEACTQSHPNSRNLKLLIIRGESLMNLVHDLYERAANEA